MGETRHYPVLDGLRGVAALMVLSFHLCEAVAYGTGVGVSGQKLYHGFLAVDFFLILSGFVMGYAYDCKWDRMSTGDFCKKRLIRLHPMVLAGAVIGIILFACQGLVDFNGNDVPVWKFVVCAVLSLFLLPALPCIEARGLMEIFPFNGPHWSLFYEYIGSFLYAVALRKMKSAYLTVIISVSAVALLLMGLLCPDHFIGYGWSGDIYGFMGGTFRLLFAYTAGLLMARYFRNNKPSEVRIPVFPVCAAVIIALLSVPMLGEKRAIFEVLCITVAFPAVIWLGARASDKSDPYKKLMNFLGRYSYPLYAIHYPFMGLYIHWIQTGKAPLGRIGTPVAIIITCLLLAFVLMKFYDEPLRKILQNKFLNKTNK